MKILGISAYYHDSAAALLVDGKIVAAAQEERFTRRKHDASFPEKAIAYVLEEGGLTARDLDYVAFYDKPFLKFERLLETYIALAPRGFQSFRRAMPIWLREKLFLKSLLLKELRKLDEGFDAEKLQFSEHHFSHAASAFYPSPFEEAAVLTLDGVGEWATASLAIGNGRNLEIIRELHFPHSLGLLYSAFTYYLGFKVNSGEYKVMGLAPYGEPRFRDLILEKLLDLKADGSFRLDLSYFDYATGLTMTNRHFEELFGQPPRPLEAEELKPFHMDVAASIQAVTEEIVLRMTRSIAREFGLSNLCLAGGVALNCVANGRVLKERIFEKLWIQPAAGDAGGALGAAYALWHKELGQPRNVSRNDSMQGTFLGPHYSDEAIAEELSAAGARFTSHAPEELIEKTARALAAGKAVGWFQGRMEFGPRALGARSILADPRLPDMQKTLNLKVKYRESFRPFAPSILEEDLGEWFDLDCENPYMLLVAGVLESRRKTMKPGDKAPAGIDRLKEVRSEIPAVTHVDYSARVQSVHRETNPQYHDLITAFKRLTGCPVLVNTSFNVRGEPIVCTPKDAFRCFMGTELDTLAIGNHFLEKADQDPTLRRDYRSSLKLD
jgi:carbamoyltransferase